MITPLLSLTVCDADVSFLGEIEKVIVIKYCAEIRLIILLHLKCHVVKVIPTH